MAKVNGRTKVNLPEEVDGDIKYSFLEVADNRAEIHRNSVGLNRGTCVGCDDLVDVFHRYCEPRKEVNRLRSRVTCLKCASKYPSEYTPYPSYAEIVTTGSDVAIDFVKELADKHQIRYSAFPLPS